MDVKLCVVAILATLMLPEPVIGQSTTPQPISATAASTSPTSYASSSTPVPSCFVGPIRLPAVLSASTPPLDLMRLPAPPKTGESWQAGLHYSVVLGSAQTRVPVSKVEVLELFMYTSPLSFQIQPYLKEWLKHKPDYIEYVRQPAIVFPHARMQARTFFTLQELGREDLHQALFAWIFEKDHYQIYHTIERPDEAGYLRLNLEFAQANKLDKARFAAVYGSKEMDDKVIKAEIATHAYLVAGTSTFVVNGRYSTSVQRVAYPKRNIEPEDYVRLFRLLEYLAASELSAN